jgi:integrase
MRLLQIVIGRKAHIRLIVMIALHTGMRRGEILNLKREDIDFHRSEIHVTKTKTDKDRNIPMTPTLARELSSHCARQKTNYLFANPKTGKPVTDIKNAFTAACVDAKIEGLWFHDLRRTAATRMGERGVDPFTIAEIMGHSDIKMTRSYTRSTMNAKRAAVVALEQACFESGPQMGHKEEQRPLLAAAG